MRRLIRENKQRLLLLLILCDAILVCCLYATTIKDEVMTTANTKPTGIQEVCNQLLVNTYLARIKEASDDFYDEYYTISPTVNYYSIVVKEISLDSRNSYVTFTSIPYLGPHDTVGIDKITFMADFYGNVTLEKFNHIISYHLPFNLKDLEKKTVPGKYGDEQKRKPSHVPSRNRAQ